MARKRKPLATVNELRAALNRLFAEDPGWGGEQILMEGRGVLEWWDGTLVQLDCGLVMQRYAEPLDPE